MENVYLTDKIGNSSTQRRKLEELLINDNDNKHEHPLEVEPGGCRQDYQNQDDQGLTLADAGSVIGQNLGGADLAFADAPGTTNEDSDRFYHNHNVIATTLEEVCDDRVWEPFVTLS